MPARRLLPSLAAFAALSEDSHCMTHRGEALLTANPALAALQLLGIELDYPPTFGAHEVIVVLSEMHVFVVALRPAKADSFHEPCFREEVEGPVYRCTAGADFKVPHPGGQFFYIDVAMVPENLAEDCLALPCEPQ